MSESTVEIRLLGKPVILGPGGEVRLRGSKTWALLARLVLADKPVSRRQIAESLFGEANDPMGSLRWALGQIRAGIGMPEAFLGDPVDVAIPPGLKVDILELGAGEDHSSASTGSFLEGVDGSWSADFDSWLTVERLVVDRHVFSSLRSQALSALARNEAKQASRLSTGMIERSPFDESGHVLLVKALVALGEQSAAELHVAECERRFLDELGIEPSGAVRSAARPDIASPSPGVSPGATARSMLESGQVAIDAGAADAGVQCLRQSVSAAQESGDRHLEAAAQAALGSALVHAVRGFDDEGSVALSRAAELADEVDDSEVAATALMELAYADVLAGRRAQAQHNLQEAEQRADGRPGLRAGILGISAMNLADWGRTSESVEVFRQSLVDGEAAQSQQRIGWTLGIGARTLIDAGLSEDADEWIARALEVIAAERWISFRPWVEVLQHEQALSRGEPPEEVRAALEHTFAISCQLGDPCWEGVAAMALGKALALSGQADEAFDWFADARVRCTRVTDTYVWVEGASLLQEARLERDTGNLARSRSVAKELALYAAKNELGALSADARDLL